MYELNIMAGRGSARPPRAQPDAPPPGPQRDIGVREIRWAAEDAVDAASDGEMLPRWKEIL